MEKLPIILKRFDGGWNTEDSSDEINLNESPDMYNVDFSKSGSVKKTDGCVLLGTDSDDESISQIIKSPNRNGLEWLFKFSGTVLKLFDSVNNIWTVIEETLTANQKWGHDTFNNVLVITSQINFARSLDLGMITRLSSAATLGDTEINLDDASLFPDSGNAYVNGAVVTYTGIGSITGSLVFTNNPSNGEAMTINGVQIIFVNTLGGVAGQVKIETSAIDTITNLRDLLTNPGTTNAQHVAVSVPNQAILSNISHTLSTLTVTLSTIDLTQLTVTEALTNVTYTPVKLDKLVGCTGVITTPVDYLCTPQFTGHIGIPKGNICTNFGGRLIVAGVLTSGGATVYGSKATSRTDFTISGGGAADDSFAEAMISKINSLKVFYDDNLNQRLMAFLSNDETYAINVEDDATLGTLVTQSFFKKITALNHFSCVVGDNDIYHVDLNNQVRTLGPHRDTTSGRNYSDSISTKHNTLFRDEFSFDNSEAVILNNEYWCICQYGSDVMNNVVIIYDMTKNAWRKRIGIISASIVVYNNKITIASSVANEVYQIIPETYSDNNLPISFRYSTLDIDYTPLNIERVRGIRVCGLISENCVLPLKLYRDFGSVLVGEFEIKGDNNIIVSASPSSSGAFGDVVFGGSVFGGIGDKKIRFFMAQLNFEKGLIDLENFRIVFENEQDGVYFEITKIKPIIITQPDSYFPTKYLSPKVDEEE